MVLPMLAGIMVVPDLILRLGADRFGVLSIAWVLVGYFGLLDLGLARGLTQLLAQQAAAGVAPSIRASIAKHVRGWMCGLGLVWAVILLIVAPWLTHTGLHIPANLQPEVTIGWVCLAVSVPLLMWAASSIGALEAYSRFAAVNAVRVPMGVATFLIPWGISHWTTHLGEVLGGLLGVRLVAALSLNALSRSYFLHDGPAPSSSSLRNIIAFGSWLTVSNLVGPILAYFDRFAIGAMLSVTAVTYYTVPFDVLSRLPSIPVAMMGVLFPLLAQAHNVEAGNSLRLNHMVSAASRLLVAFWVPGLVVCGLLGPVLLAWWVGPQLALASSGVWAWIAVGVLINGFAHIPYTLLQSAGRTDITAKFHLIELAPYLLALWWALSHYDIVGAAAVWTLRVSLDTALLYIGAARLFPALRAVFAKSLAWAIVASAVLALSLYIQSSRSVTINNAMAGCLILLALIWSVYHMHTLRQAQTQL